MRDSEMQDGEVRDSEMRDSEVRESGEVFVDGKAVEHPEVDPSWAVVEEYAEGVFFGYEASNARAALRRMGAEEREGKSFGPGE